MTKTNGGSGDVDLYVADPNKPCSCGGNGHRVRQARVARIRVIADGMHANAEDEAAAWAMIQRQLDANRATGVVVEFIEWEEDDG